MFKNLFEFNYRRNFIEAIGFYVIYCVIAGLIIVFLAMAAGFLMAAVLRFLNPDNANSLIFEYSRITGRTVGYVTNVVLSFLLATALFIHKYPKDALTYLLLIMSFALSLFGFGFIFSFIPIAALTMGRTSKCKTICQGTVVKN